MDVETPHGTARVHLHQPEGAGGLLVLGHGAGGGVGAPDLVAAKEVALEEGFAVALVEQPYRVAGRRSPAPAKQLDAAWIAVVAHLRSGAAARSASARCGAGAGGAAAALIVGGRSSGARVACRTARETAATGVLCLAFPLVTPRGRSRLDELEAVDVPVLVVQGVNDRFGMPPPGPRRTVVQIEGDHGLKKDHDRLRAAVRDFLR